jgi:two-component system LytT family response regulator
MKTISNYSFNNVIRPTRKKRKNVLTVHHGGKVTLLEAQEVVYLEGDGNYTYVHTIHARRFLVSKTMKTVDKILNAGFLRIHKSYMINPVHLTARVETDRLLLKGGKQLPIARRRIIEIQEMLAGEYLKVG